MRELALLIATALLPCAACTGQLGPPDDDDAWTVSDADGDFDGDPSCDNAACATSCVAGGFPGGACDNTAACACFPPDVCTGDACIVECTALGYPGGACDAEGACTCLPLAVVCGAHGCEPGEDCTNCPADCGACPASCGANGCEPGEDCTNCPADCGACPASCGTGGCEAGEDCANCPIDCGACPAVCGNGACEAGEDTDTCAGDCCPVTDTVYVDPGESIQAAMDCAQTYARSHTAEWPDHTRGDALYGRVVINPGTHDLDAPLATRAHVRIEAYGAEIVNRSGAHIMHVDDNGGGGYNAPATYWTIVGGVWNANGGGGFSIVHTRKFVLWDLEIRDIGYFGHHLEINSSGGEYAPGVNNVVVHAVRIHGVSADARVDDEAINIDYSWDGAAHNTANDGTVTNNVLIEDCEFWDVPRAVSTHHFQTDGGAPLAEFSGITIRGGSFHDIDPSAAATGDNFENDGAIRPYGWQNVVIENVTFTNCATAISLYAPSDFPDALGSVGSFVIRNNTFSACGLARHDGIALPVIYSRSANPETAFWDVVVQGNTVAGDWVATGEYFVATYDTHNCSITGNQFAPTNLSVSEERDYNKYKAQGDSNTGTWDLSGNTVSDGSVDNS
jgi:hypothetical protein